MAALRKPENPRNFKDLKECKAKYTELSKNLERFYKRKRLKRGIFRGTIGVLTVIAAGYFIFKK